MPPLGEQCDKWGRPGVKSLKRAEEYWLGLAVRNSPIEVNCVRSNGNGVLVL